MDLRLWIYILLAGYTSVHTATIPHDQVQPFAQSEPVTASEKASIKFKPKLWRKGGCFPYPAVNAASETSGGLKPPGGDSDCTDPPQNSQVYGRAVWYNDVWAIMYAWYFPKGYGWEVPKRRHEWISAVVWIDNPAVATPKVLALSNFSSYTEYFKDVPVSDVCLDQGTHPRLYVWSEPFDNTPVMDCGRGNGEQHDLIMWEQLTESARLALNSTDLGEAKVTFIDSTFQQKLDEAWPFY